VLWGARIRSMCLVRQNLEPRLSCREHRSAVRWADGCPTFQMRVFRVNLYDLPPKTTYYYTVESMDSSGKSDGVTSPIKTFTTQ
jgi:hypothetical protein